MPLDCIPQVLFQTAGRVYGVVLNDQTSVNALGDALNDAPYKAPPVAPVVYLKPANTHATSGADVVLPHGESAVEVGATLGLVMARSAARLNPADALESLAGVVLVADLSLPHSSYYRPAVREKSFDGSCVMSQLLPLSALENAQITISGGRDAQATRDFGDLLRSPAQLLADVSEFMTLEAGDILLVGVRWNAPQANVGDTVTVSLADQAQLTFTLAGAQA